MPRWAPHGDARLPWPRPDPLLREAVVGLDLSHGREHLARALVNGIVLESCRYPALLAETGGFGRAAEPDTADCDADTAVPVLRWTRYGRLWASITRVLDPAISVRVYAGIAARNRPPAVDPKLALLAALVARRASSPARFDRQQRGRAARLAVRRVAQLSPRNPNPQAQEKAGYSWSWRCTRSSGSCGCAEEVRAGEHARGIIPKKCSTE